MPKAVRFTDLVKVAGKPYVEILWKEADANPKFSRAIDENRVLTVTHAHGRPDVGSIGFHPNQQAAYLVFPKPLPHIGETRVIGMKYELLDNPEVNDPVAPRKASLKKPKRQSADADGAPVLKQKKFTAILCRTAKWEIPLNVMAANKEEAEEKLMEMANQTPINLSQAIIRNELKK